MLWLLLLILASFHLSRGAVDWPEEDLTSVNSSNLFLKASLPDDNESDLNQCLEKVIRRFFTGSSIVSLISNDDSATNQAMRTWASDFGIILVNRQNSNVSVESKRAVIFEDDPSRLHLIFQDMVPRTRGRYVVVTKMNNRSLEQIGAKLWKEKFPDVIFLKHEGAKKIAIYGYDILSQYTNTSGLQLLDCYWNKSFLRNADLFPSKFSDMKGYELKVATLANTDTEPDVFRFRRRGRWCLSGVAGNFVQVFAQKLNFRLVVINEHPAGWGVKLPNGTWTGMIGQIIRGDVDLGFGAISSSIRNVECMDYSLFYRWECLIFTTIASDFEISWKGILHPLSVDTWICTILSILGYTGLTRIIARLHQAGLLKERVRMMNVWSTMLYQNASYPKGCQLRAIFAIWLMTSYLIGTAYTTSLVSWLTKPICKKNLDTFQELKDSGTPLGATIAGRHYLNNTDEPLLYYYYHRYVAVNYKEVRSSMFTKNIAVISMKSSAQYYNSKHRRRASKRLHLSKDVIFGFPSMFYFPRGHPYLKPFNRLLGLAHSFGLVVKWLRDYNSNDTGEKLQERVVLRLTHLAGVFLTLGVGLSIGTTVFFFELYRGISRMILHSGCH